jgi:hypothetical protein
MLNPHNIRYYLSQLELFGYIRIIGGSKYKSGYEYEITDKDEYIRLNNEISNTLDIKLNEVKSMVASVANCCELG